MLECALEVLDVFIMYSVSDIKRIIAAVFTEKYTMRNGNLPSLLA